MSFYLLGDFLVFFSDSECFEAMRPNSFSRTLYENISLEKVRTIQPETCTVFVLTVHLVAADITARILLYR